MEVRIQAAVIELEGKPWACQSNDIEGEISERKETQRESPKICI